MKAWPKVALGELLRRADETVLIDPEQEYHEVTIKLWGKGVVSRGMVRGSDVVAVRRMVRANQLILSKIDARNGAIGMVPAELDGAIVSQDFPSFEFQDIERCDPAFMGWLVRAAPFVELCKAASEGTTNRVRIKEERFLAQQISLPPLTEQQALVRRLDTLADRVRQVNAHLDAIEQGIGAMLLSLHHRFADNRVRRLGDILDLHEDPVRVTPDCEYPQVGVRGFGGGLFAKPAVMGTETSYKAFNRLYADALVLSQVKGWEGAIALCPPELEGMFVSPEYRTFRCRPDESCPGYLGELMRTPWFWSLLQEATRGVGARRERTRPEQFLNIELPMPKLEDQRKALNILSRQTQLTAHHTVIRNANDALIPATLERLFAADHG
ncbi:restriction endonuclease subunit S [Allochromatium humboldtianum]|uniref:Restriction endonuclease subunit S n=1 Tax=Allochromatium humboldtianum TaxID=504901 RepID=A0A850RA38_9GAMM|nr:restriction endonuclease subunit S [Allochromatium humboldtianum]NVZ11609.1 restriction endonuclease subunit S [Allochromatium humboldtianum]